MKGELDKPIFILYFWIPSKSMLMKQMLDFVKHVLTQVSFDKDLFRKELKKGLRWISPGERALLLTWCIAHFGQTHQDVIKDVFRL